eukprot:scaffold139030_cov136-Phaeocystis_antarctica.AAC.1
MVEPARCRPHSDRRRHLACRAAVLPAAARAAGHRRGLQGGRGAAAGRYAVGARAGRPRRPAPGGPRRARYREAYRHAQQRAPE